MLRVENGRYIVYHKIPFLTWPGCNCLFEVILTGGERQAPNCGAAWTEAAHEDIIVPPIIRMITRKGDSVSKIQVGNIIPCQIDIVLAIHRYSPSSGVTIIAQNLCPFSVSTRIIFDEEQHSIRTRCATNECSIRQHQIVIEVSRYIHIPVAIDGDVSPRCVVGTRAGANPFNGTGGILLHEKISPFVKGDSETGAERTDMAGCINIAFFVNDHLIDKIVNPRTATHGPFELLSFCIADCQ